MSSITKALVTGASGFIGRALVESLVSQGIPVIAVDRNRAPHEECQSAQLDISVPGALDEFADEKTVIFHMAARASVQASVINPTEDFNSTCAGVFQILETARRTRARVVFPSTASIFDPDNELPVSERSFVKPSSPYGAAKVAGEAYCAVYHRCYGVDVRIARMFSVYGIGMNRFAIHDFIRSIQRNGSVLEIQGDGQQVRDYLYIDDVVTGLQVIADKGVPGEDYNLASGYGISIQALARKIAFLMGCPDIEIRPSGRNLVGDVPKWYGDVGKLRSIGFEAAVDLSEGLEKTINWLNKS